MKELNHCTQCNQMTNWENGKCLKCPQNDAIEATIDRIVEKSIDLQITWDSRMRAFLYKSLTDMINDIGKPFPPQPKEDEGPDAFERQGYIPKN